MSDRLLNKSLIVIGDFNNRIIDLIESRFTDSPENNARIGAMLVSMGIDLVEDSNLLNEEEISVVSSRISEVMTVLGRLVVDKCQGIDGGQGRSESPDLQEFFVQKRIDAE